MITISDQTSNKIRNMSVLCMLFVLMIHCYPQFSCWSFSFWLGELTVGGLCHISVPFFFVVSGIFLGRKIELGNLSNTYRGEVKKRIRTLIVPYVIWMGLFWVTVNLAGNALRLYRGEALLICIPTLRQLGLHPGGGLMLESLWYVRAVFIFVLISPVLLWSGRRVGAKRFLMALFLVYAILCPWRPLPTWGVVQDVTRCSIFSVSGLFYFAVGLFLGNGLIGGVRIGGWTFIGGCLMLICRALLSYGNVSYSHYFGFLALPWLLYGLYRLVPSCRWPNWLTHNVFAVFLVHGFIYLILRRIGILPASNWSVVVFVAIGTYALIGSVVEVIRCKGCMLSGVLFGGR